MTGITVFIHINPLIIEDLQINTITHLRNARATIPKLVKDATLNVNFHIPHSKDSIIRINIRLTFVNNLMTKRSLAKKVNYALSFIMTLNKDISPPARCCSYLID